MIWDPHTAHLDTRNREQRRRDRRAHRKPGAPRSWMFAPLRAAYSIDRTPPARRRRRKVTAREMNAINVILKAQSWQG